MPMARLRPRGAARLAPSLSTLARLAGRPWCPPSLLRQVLRVRQGKAAYAARVSIWPAAAPLVRNSPRGWAPKTLPNPEVRVGRADEAKPLRLLVRRSRRTVNPAQRSPSSARGSTEARKSLNEPAHARTSATAVTVPFGGHTHAN